MLKKGMSLLAMVMLVAGIVVGSELIKSKELRTRAKPAGEVAPCEDPKYCYDRCSRKPDPANPDEVCTWLHPNFPKEPEVPGCLGCGNPPPACCEVMAATGNAGACCNYPEYLWCRPEQCAKVTYFPSGPMFYDPGRCGHAWKGWGCQEKKEETPTPPPPTLTPPPFLPSATKILSPSPFPPTVRPIEILPTLPPTIAPSLAISPTFIPPETFIFPPIYPPRPPSPTPTPSFSLIKIKKTSEDFLRKVTLFFQFFFTAILP